MYTPTLRDQTHLSWELTVEVSEANMITNYPWPTSWLHCALHLTSNFYISERPLDIGLLYRILDVLRVVWFCGQGERARTSTTLLSALAIWIAHGCLPHLIAITSLPLQALWLGWREGPAWEHIPLFAFIPSSQQTNIRTRRLRQHKPGRIVQFETVKMVLGPPEVGIWLQILPINQANPIHSADPLSLCHSLYVVLKGMLQMFQKHLESP